MMYADERKETRGTVRRGGGMQRLQRSLRKSSDCTGFMISRRRAQIR